MKFAKITAALLAVAILFTSLPVFAAQSGDGESRIYFYNTAGNGAANGDFIIVESQGRYGLIDAGHRYSSEIKDERGVHLLAPMSASLSSQVAYKNGVDAAEYMIETLGIKHLDFIIGTHSHSDHIGGIPEIAQYTFEDGGESKNLVDSDTVYIYKDFRHINNLTDDLEEYTSTSWHTQAFYYQAKKTMASKGAGLVEVSKGVMADESPSQPRLDYGEECAALEAAGLTDTSYYQGDSGNFLDDYIAFTFGNLSMRIYNLFSHYTTVDENVNSIVVTITDGNLRVASLADINVDDRTEQRLAREISSQQGTMDLVKVAHHGGKGSNARETLDCFKPRYAVVTRKENNLNGDSSNSSFSLALYYSKTNYSTVFYEVGSSDFALVAQFGEDDFEFSNLTGRGDDVAFESAENCINNMTYADGWSRWDNEWGDNPSSDYYYFEDNRLRTGWLKDDESFYYLDTDGRMLTGWQFIEGEWYYFRSNGVMKTGWLGLDDSWYYLGNDGIMNTGWVKISGKWYYFSSNGVMQTGWTKLGDKWYYFKDDGSAATGWTVVDGDYYYFDSNFNMYTSWHSISGKWYYFSSKGVMQTGWMNLAGKWYHFDDAGAMTTGWKQFDGGWYYFDQNGIMKTGWVSVGSKWYYFASNGVMRTGWLKSGGKWYFFDAKGIMQTGWVSILGSWYYFNSNGTMVTGWQKISSRWYYFDQNGKMTTGVRNIGGKAYVFASNGVMKKG